MKLINKDLKKKLNKKILIGLGIILPILILSILLTLIIGSKPTLALQGPSKAIEVGDKNEIVIPVVLNKLPNDEYPAASTSIKFDNRKLEFVEVKSGTMESYNNYDENIGNDKKDFKIPQWTYNIEAANRDGIANIMYLDTTAGKNAYTKDGFEKGNKDMLFKIVFRLKDSALPKEKLKVEIEEAVLATVTGEEDKTSLSTKEGFENLKVKSTYIKVSK